MAGNILKLTMMKELVSSAKGKMFKYIFTGVAILGYVMMGLLILSTL